MSILTAEMKFMKAKEVSDAATNGGRMSENEYVSGALNNVWPNYFSADRLAGGRWYRKLFCLVDNDADLSGVSPMLRLFMQPTAGDWLVLSAATPRDTQTDIGATDKKYGAGTLNTDVSAGGATLIADLVDNTLKSGNDAIFAVADYIYITDKATWDAGTGNLEKHKIAMVTPHATLAQVTLTLDGTTLTNAYLKDVSMVMSIIEPADVETSFDNWVETCAGTGTYDETANPPILDNMGTREETVTLTFTDATNYTVIGDTLGSLGSGTTGADFTATNPDTSKPYLTLEAAGWAGAWAADDTIVLQLHAATYALWEHHILPAVCGSLANNKTTLVWSVESA